MVWLSSYRGSRLIVIYNGDDCKIRWHYPTEGFQDSEICRTLLSREEHINIHDVAPAISTVLDLVKFVSSLRHDSKVGAGTTEAPKQIRKGIFIDV